jgi:DNA repair protein RecO (recombination protein O)
MAIRSEQGIVLRSYPFGEADRVVVLLSPNRGKMRTVAKGVRKTKSRFGGRLEPFTHIDVVVYEGRQLDTITQVSVIDPFAHLRLDLERVMAAGTMVEAVDAVAQEGQNSHRLFLLLQRGLKALDRGGGGRDLVSAFLLKLAGVVGVEPALTRCASCGKPGTLDRFSFSGGGAMCPDCRTDSAVKLRPGLTGYLAGLAAADLAFLPETDPALSGEAMGVARRFVEFHLDRRLASLALLDG